MMLLTEGARDVIRMLTGDTKNAPAAGVRIAVPATSNGEAAGFSLGVAPGPQPGDEITDNAGVRVFLDPVAAASLDGRTLDVTFDPSSRDVEFFLADPT